MALTLKVLRYKGQPPIDELSLTLDRGEAVIGRSAGSDFTLPDPEHYISRKHALVKWQDGDYYLTDESLSGTVLDGAPALKGETVKLHDGARLEIGDYELLVSISAPEPPPSETDDLVEPWLKTAVNRQADLLEEAPPSSSAPERPELEALLESEEGPDLMSDDKPVLIPDEPVMPEEEFQDHGADHEWISPSIESPIHQDFVPPSAIHESEAPEQPPIPDFDYEDLLKPLHTQSFSLPEEALPPESPAEEAPPAQPPPAAPIKRQPTKREEPARPQRAEPARPAAPPPAPHATAAPELPQVASGQERALVAAFLEGAGLSELDFGDDAKAREIMLNAGRTFRALVSGLMMVLRARSEVKSEFRISMTMVQPAGNNPLKFSVTVEDAIRHLLTPRESGFLEPVTAVKDGVKDLSGHQLAMASGVQASLKQLLSRFDPEVLERRLDQGLVLQKKAKCWDAYKETYARLVEEASEDFFGEEFVRAYQEQMFKLRMTRDD